MRQSLRSAVALIVVIVLSGLTAMAAPATARPAPSTASTAAITAAGSGIFLGPDVSSWQHSGGAINWAAAAGASVSFAFIKATEGPAYTNPYFAGDFAGAGNAGLYRGAYHFARPALPISTAADQARQFVAVTGVLHGALDLPPVLDLEASGGLGPADLANWTATWLSAVQQLTGRVPMIYASPNFWASALGNTTSLSGYPLWIARWTTASDPLPLPGGWTSWLFWQYTSTGAVPGISGNVDLSRFCCSLAKLAEVSGSPSGRPLIALRNTPTTGVADQTYVYSAPAGGKTLMCDWNGDGVDTPGVFLDGTWYITDTTNGGLSQTDFGYGNPGDQPVCGDWNGDGHDSPGIVRQGLWYLVDTIGKPTADHVFGYGDPHDIPIVGDWNGDGHDSPGIVRQGLWYLVDTIGKPTADYVFGYGDPHDIPIVGDWNGDGHDSPGIVRQGLWYLVDTIGKPTADHIFAYGDPHDAPLTGAWQHASPTSIGITRPTF